MPSFLCLLEDGKVIGVPFEELKKDYPIEMAKCVQKHVVSKRRGDCHQVWAKNLVSHRWTLIESLELTHGKRKMHHLSSRQLLKRKTKSKSRNARLPTNEMREKFGVVVLNTVKEALSLDKTNGD